MTFNYIAAKKVFDCKFFIEDKFPNAIDIVFKHQQSEKTL